MNKKNEPSVIKYLDGKKIVIDLNSEFGRTFKFAAIGMALVDQEGRWIIANNSLCKLLEYSQEELQKLTFQDITHPDDLEKDLEKVRKLYGKEIDSYQIEKRYITQSGRILWINLSGSAVWNEDGSFRYYIAQIQDITKEKEAVELLAEKESLFRGIFNSTFQFIGFLNTEGLVYEANQTALNFAGLKPEDVIGKNFWDCYWWQISPSTQKKLKKSIKKAAAGEFIQYEVEVWGRDRTPSTILFNLKPVFGESHEVIALIAEGRLIQDIVDARNALIRNNEELEQFTSIASHDLKEPLRMVKSFGQLLQRHYAGKLDEKGQQYIGFMLDAVGRMGLLIDDLLEYSRVGDELTGKEEINTQELIQEVLNLYTDLIEGKSAKIYFSELPKIRAKRVPMKLLFQNLIGNALKYQKIGELPLIKIVGEDKGSFWKFSISDNGIGIKEEYQKEVFKLFRRLHTNQEYKGSGMGLAICKKVVNQHKGEIWLESEVGRGSTVYFTLKK
ncbi:sensor histidine kinase [Algoriphagus faecimaris]|nr:PAS domain-containing sensor histidine kinase [Algoriphagus faecimaris]